ncbi:hypothetical protein I7I48_11071 [Histoplasma ohiense]|nr:hypothetical protein I7I48_11071 [Histoplasma ohiense (nom. inval.)]
MGRASSPQSAFHAPMQLHSMAHYSPAPVRTVFTHVAPKLDFSAQRMTWWPGLTISTVPGISPLFSFQQRSSIYLAGSSLRHYSAQCGGIKARISYLQQPLP